MKQIHNNIQCGKLLKHTIERLIVVPALSLIHKMYASIRLQPQLPMNRERSKCFHVTLANQLH